MIEYLCSPDLVEKPVSIYSCHACTIRKMFLNVEIYHIVSQTSTANDAGNSPGEVGPSQVITPTEVSGIFIALSMYS